MSLRRAEQIPFDRHYFQSKIPALWDPVLTQFHKILSRSFLFHLCFLTIGITEILFFLIYLSAMGQSQVLAFALAIFFLSLFSFFVLRLYFVSKKPEELSALCQNYLYACKELIRFQEGIPEHHLALANAAHKFAASLHEKEYTYFSSFALTSSLVPIVEKFSCFCFWQDLHRLKETLLEEAVEQHLKVVKCEPINLEVHAALANAYVMLSSLYADPSKFEISDEERWIPPERHSQEMQMKFRNTAEKAIEEFKILNDYAPNDPWVHVQLAYSYHDLQMPEEEIREYETVLKLKPHDPDTLFKLGMLYFQQGKNALGLKVYESLKKSHYKKAEHLIKFYGSFDQAF